MSDMEIFMDMMDSKDIIHDEIIENNQRPEYYSAKAIHIRRQLEDNTTNYFHFLKEFLEFVHLSLCHQVLLFL